MACAKLSLHLIIIFPYKAICVFTRIALWAHNSNVKWISVIVKCGFKHKVSFEVKCLVFSQHLHFELINYFMKWMNGSWLTYYCWRPLGINKKGVKYLHSGLRRQTVFVIGVGLSDRFEEGCPKLFTSGNLAAAILDIFKMISVRNEGIFNATWHSLMILVSGRMFFVVFFQVDEGDCQYEYMHQSTRSSLIWFR